MVGYSRIRKAVVSEPRGDGFRTLVLVPAPLIVRSVPPTGDNAPSSWSHGHFLRCSRFLAGERSSRPQADRQRTKSNLRACTRNRDGRRAVAV